MADRFERVLTAARDNFYEEYYELSGENFPEMGGPDWSISKYPLRGGKQDGVDIVEVNNGQLNVVVVPTRGMSILEALTSDASLGWNSPVRQVVHPAYVNEQAGGGLGWLEGFNEFIARCGLAYNGLPGQDVVTTNTGEKKEVFLPLHGTVANCPATRLSVQVSTADPPEIAVVGEVCDTQMFGPCLRLVSKVSTAPGSGEFTITDEVQNLSATPQELELLYHCNYGQPLLGEGARLVAPVEMLVPRDGRAQEGVETWDLYGPPQPGFVEQCYFLRMHGDEEQNTVLALVSPDETTAASMRYSVRQLPAFTIWKNTAAVSDGYVTGLEPGTDYPNNRSFERKNGRVVELEAGGTYGARLTFGIVRGADEVARLVEEVDSLRAGKESTFCEELLAEYCPSG